eukprot:TRINITY_DN47068_c0_g1_i1.p2 TRINITY_DN47068_c0_g1~~TRINITY_DN47068_c0_g1_i1.p2  ORF type:complete len:149 (+),score=23.19 TRINITY_DN47068_c0_g1_i1:39-485(+)
MAASVPESGKRCKKQSLSEEQTGNAASSSSDARNASSLETEARERARIQEFASRFGAESEARMRPLANVKEAKQSRERISSKEEKDWKEKQNNAMESLTEVTQNETKEEGQDTARKRCLEKDQSRPHQESKGCDVRIGTGIKSWRRQR